MSTAETPPHGPRAIRQGQPVDYAKILTTAAIWGSAFMLISVGLQAFPPMAVAAIRVLVGGVVLTAIGLLVGEKWPRGGKVWLWLALIGFLNTAVPFALIAWGQQGVLASRAAILMATVPFVTLMLSHFSTSDDRISGAKVFGLTLGISGVILVVGLDAFTATGQSIIGQFAIMGAACCYAVSNVMTRRISHVPPMLGTAACLMTATIYMGPGLYFFWWPENPSTDWQPYAALLALGIGPTAIAYVLRFQVIRDVGSTFMSQVGYLVPLFGVLWAWAVLNEVPGWTSFAAMVLILAGIRVTQMKPRKAKPETP